MGQNLEVIIRAFSTAKPVSIWTYSSQIIKVMQGLSIVDEAFCAVQFEGERMKSVKVDLSLLSDEDALKKIAESIIEFNRYDIRKFGKTKDPDFNYVPAHPISMLAKFETQQGEMYFIINMGSYKAVLPDAWICRNGAVIERNGLGWAKGTFRVMMDTLDYGFGSVGSFYRDDIRQGNFEGWLLNYSYFSRSGPYIVPEGIPGVEYEETDKGVYLSIGNKLCTSTDDPEYQEQKRIRLEATRRIKQANGIN